MTTATIIKTLLEVLAVALVAYGIYNEKKVIRFERNFAKVVKACFRELMRKDTETVRVIKSNVVTLHSDEIAVVAKEHENKSKVIDFKIA